MVTIHPTDDRAAAIVRRQMTRQGVDALLLGAGADLRAFSGYDAHVSERMTLLVVRRDGTAPVMVVPALEEPAARVGSPETSVTTYAEGAAPAAVAAGLLRDLGPDATIAVGDQLWARFLLELQQELSGPDGRRQTWVAGSPITRHLRMVKDDDGLAGLRTAGQAIDRVHAQIADFLVPGRTEREVAGMIAGAMREEGHDAVDFAIVASGPNGASPHHETSDRVIGESEGIVVDIGGPVSGWFSDCTRNYVIGQPTPDYREAFDVLRQAQQTAVSMVRPGVTAASVDAAARDIIAEAGFGEAFIHRTGHGIGLEVHEEPYITQDNDLVLEAGNDLLHRTGHLPARPIRHAHRGHRRRDP